MTVELLTIDGVPHLRGPMQWAKRNEKGLVEHLPSGTFLRPISAEEAEQFAAEAALSGESS